MAEQLDMFDLMERDPDPVRWHELPRRTVVARAMGEERSFTVREGEADPFEMEIRGVPCLIECSFGFSTYAIDPHGSPFWSSTGFRSFASGFHSISDPELIRSVVEAHIDGSTKNGGCGGVLAPWWPLYATQWRDGAAFMLAYGADRSKLWNQWGPEKHAEVWAAKDASFAADLQRMKADGIDPNDLGKPSHFKGKWPRFTYESKLEDLCP